MGLLWVASVQQKLMSKAPGLDCFLKESLCKLQSTGSRSAAPGCGRTASHQSVKSKQGRQTVYQQA